MRFGLFGSAQSSAENLGAGIGQGFHDYIDYNVEAEALGYYSTFLVEHHFTGWSQISVSMAPGMISLTETPVPSRSTTMDSLQPARANFEPE